MPFILLEPDKSLITSSASIKCMNMRLPPVILPSSISWVTKAMARISRISDELKLISCMRLRIARELVGSSGRSVGVR